MKAGGGVIRSMKEMFKILKFDEKEKLKAEEEGNSSDDGASSKKDDKFDSGSDSDPQEDDLDGVQQEALFSNIKGAIDQFENYFNKDSKKNVKVKKKKVIQRNIKSPLANFP